jgi:hypothetical protein
MRFVTRVIVTLLALALFVPAASASEYSLYFCKKAKPNLLTGDGLGIDCKKSDAIAEAKSAALAEFMTGCHPLPQQCKALCEASGAKYSNSRCVAEREESLYTYQHGNHTCGIWPFRTIPHYADFTVTGFCGCSCQTSVANY